MSLISERASRLSNDMVRSFAERAPKNEVKVAADRASKSLDQLILSRPTTHNIVTYHNGAEESFNAILGALQGAKKSFHVETFIWHDDETGRKLADAIVEKVKSAKAEGKTFDAKVLIDSMGIGGGYGTHDHNIITYLNAHGVDARIFNPRKFSLSAKGHLPLTHRKMYIADGEKYLVGGRNVGDEYFKPTYHMKWGDESSVVNSYHDFLMTVQGDEAARVQGQFYKNWARVGGTVPAELPKPIPAPGGHTKIQTFVTDPLTGEQGVKQAHLDAIANAKHEVMVISPYFADDDLVKALVSAKANNPKLTVKALMPALGEKGKDLNYEMDMDTSRRLLDAGVEVRLSKGGVENGKTVERFSHFKGMVIDGKLLSIGSANADHRTYNNNHEIINMIGDRQKVKEFQDTIANPDWAAAQPIDQSFLAQNATLGERALRRIGHALNFLY